LWCDFADQVNLLELAYAELGAAAVIDPETAAVCAPGLALDARGAADLPGEADVTSVDGAPVAAAIVRGAGDDLSLALLVRSPLIATVTADGEFGAATVVDPESATAVDAPTVVATADGAADLTGHVDVPEVETVGGAPVALAVVGGAGDDLTLLALLPLIAAVPTDRELGAAATIDPESAIVVAPGVVLDAGGAADLAGELDAAAGVDVTVVALAIVGRAGDDLSLAVAAGLKNGTGRSGKGRRGIGEGA